MDPTTALRDLVEAVADGDRERTIDLLDGLSEWLKKNGFMPDPFVAPGA